MYFPAQILENLTLLGYGQILGLVVTNEGFIRFTGFAFKTRELEINSSLFGGTTQFNLYAWSAGSVIHTGRGGRNLAGLARIARITFVALQQTLDDYCNFRRRVAIGGSFR